MIRRNRDVGGAPADHSQHRRQNAADRAHLKTILVARGRQSVVMPEQFVSAVDQMNLQGAPPRTTLHEPQRCNQLET